MARTRAGVLRPGRVRVTIPDTSFTSSHSSCEEGFRKNVRAKLEPPKTNARMPPLCTAATFRRHRSAPPSPYAYAAIALRRTHCHRFAPPSLAPPPSLTLPPLLTPPPPQTNAVARLSCALPPPPSQSSARAASNPRRDPPSCRRKNPRGSSSLRPRGAGSRARGLRRRRRCAPAASSSWFWKTSSSSHFACWQECRGGPKSGQPRWGEGRWGSKAVLKTKEQSVTQPRYDAPPPPLWCFEPGPLCPSAPARGVAPLWSLTGQEQQVGVVLPPARASYLE